MLSVEEVFIPDQQKHVSFMGMIVDQKCKDSVIINTEPITLISERCESFKLKLQIDGKHHFASNYNK